MLGAPTVSLIHSYHVKTHSECLGTSPQHILRFAGAFESMDKNDGRVFLRRYLPVTFGQQPRSCFNLKQSGGCTRQSREIAWPIRRHYSDQVRISKPRVRFKPAPTRTLSRDFDWRLDRHLCHSYVTLIHKVSVRRCALMSMRRSNAETSNLSCDFENAVLVLCVEPVRIDTSGLGRLK